MWPKWASCFKAGTRDRKQKKEEERRKTETRSRQIKDCELRADVWDAQ